MATKDTVLRAAQVAHTFQDRVISDVTSMQEWRKYINLTAGTHKVSFYGVYESYVDWLEHHDLVDHQASPDELYDFLCSYSIPVEESLFDDLFSVNLSYGAIKHISAPKTILTGQLNPKRQHAADREFIDYDYLPNLKPSEAVWLAKFTDEYYHQHAVGDETDLMGSTDEKRGIYKMKRARRKDIYNPEHKKQKRSLNQRKCNIARTRFFDMEEYFLVNSESPPESPEDAIIEYIDAKYKERGQPWR